MFKGLTTVLAIGLLPLHAHAYGEQEDTFPSATERQIHLFTDMLRVEPSAFWDGEEEYGPVRPLVYNADLNRAAFAHAHDMNLNDCFQHESCDGTPFDERVSGYYPDYISVGENIAMGQESSYRAVFDSWLHSDGHRANMLHAAFNELGTGYDEDGTAAGRWYVQDFGKRAEVEEPYLTSGTHWPANADVGDTVAFYVTYYDPAGVEPDWIALALDEDCHEMELAFGSPEMGVYAWETVVEEGTCVPYKFVANVAGTDVPMPTEGALVMTTGGAICDSYTPEPPPAPCTGGDGDEAGGCEPQACSTGTDNDPFDDNDVENSEYGSCNQSSRARHPFAAVVAAGILLLARRRLVWSRR